jgi:hypothetical protein
MSNRRLVLATTCLAHLSRPGNGAELQGTTRLMRYYISNLGHAVPRPCGDWHHQAPSSDATARCGDGTYSYSEHPSAPGACSHHGGVNSYLR